MPATLAWILAGIVAGSPELASAAPPAPATSPSIELDAEQSSPPATRIAAPPPSDASGREWNALCLRRSVALWRKGEIALAVEALLERDDFDDEEADPQPTDRADFLLALGLHLLGDARARNAVRTAFERSRLDRSREWLEAIETLARARDAGADTSAGPGWPSLISADALVRGGRAGEAVDLLNRSKAVSSASTELHEALLARATEELGGDVTEALDRLSRLSGAGELANTLTLGAALALAARSNVEGALSQPDPHLLENPLGPRARHLAGVLGLARNDTTAAREALEELAELAPFYAGLTEVETLLGMIALAERRWPEARLRLSRADSLWHLDMERIEALEKLGPEEVSRISSVWRERGEAPGALLFDAPRLEESLCLLAGERLNLRANLTYRVDPRDDFRVSKGRIGFPAALASPDPQQQERLNEHSRNVVAARQRSRAAQFLLARERGRFTREADYLRRAAQAASSAVDSLESISARLSEARARSVALVERLAYARDEAIGRIARRTQASLHTCTWNLVFLRSIRRLHLEGPSGALLDHVPPGIPAPSEILNEDEALLAELERWSESFANFGPDLLRRSHDERWVPGTSNRAAALADSLARELERARALEKSLARRQRESELTDPLAALSSRARDAAAEVEALQEKEAALRRDLVAEGLRVARERHRSEGEGLAYALAVATHELAEASQDPEAEIQGDDVGKLRDEAVERYRDFLERYSGSRSESEVHLRLADLLLEKAKDDFRVQVSKFFADPQAAPIDRTALAPFADYSKGLAELHAVLENDPHYEHRDLALFHAGMILADEGDPRAARYLEELIELHPDSPHFQEAHLRLGEELFLKEELDAAATHFEAAASGPNAEHAAVALYRAGWAYYNRDRFDDAASSFRRLLDLYEENPEAARATDLHQEAENYLVHALARAGGIEAYDRLFAEDRGPNAGRTLTGLGHLLRRFSQFQDAAATDSLWIERYPTSPEALQAAERLIQTHERSGETEKADHERLAYATRFVEGTPWWQANESDSIRSAATQFARGATRHVALQHHHRARETHRAADWRRSLELYEETLARWPESTGADTLHLYAGEVCAELGLHARAIAHFDAVASSKSLLSNEASWQGIAVRDAWYESTRAAGGTTLGADSLASAVIVAIDAALAARPSDPHAADMRWRKGHLAHVHGREAEARSALAELAKFHPEDERSVQAAQLRAQILYDGGGYHEAAGAYRVAADLASAKGADSTAHALEALVPHCLFREAETASSSDPEGAARLFVDLASQFPSFSHADQALYRAGAAYGEAGANRRAAETLTELVARYPRSEYVRDARLELAKAWERDQDPRRAASALEEFADAHPEDDDAATALLHAIELFEQSKDGVAAERLKSDYLEKHPDDVDFTFEVVEERALRELAMLEETEPISKLLLPEGFGKEAVRSNLSRYLDLAEAHPEKASKTLLAQVAFLQGEEARAQLERCRLAQPLPPSVAKKKAFLETTIHAYQAAASHGAPPWNRAAAFRIGECLVGFGDALLDSERPAGLAGDDILAYDEVLEDQSLEFFQKGEDTWSELLRHAEDPSDPWVTRAKTMLWPRLATRFLHVAELEYPQIGATDEGEPSR